MIWDCIIIGGGPAGLNAALVLGRARREVLLLDQNQPRNRVTHASHGFITRDGISPAEFRRAAHQDLAKYPSIFHKQTTIISVWMEGREWLVQDEFGELYRAQKLILATGVVERLPAVEGLSQFYGTSLFNCPYCDGWELQNQPLVVISESSAAYHQAMMLTQWTNDIVVCTNGAQGLRTEQISKLNSKGIPVYRQPITQLLGSQGRLRQIRLTDGMMLERSGGFVSATSRQAALFIDRLALHRDEFGGIMTDRYGRTNLPGFYAAGDAAQFAPSQLIVAAAAGCKAAMGVNLDLTMERF